jgi:adenine deaminase
MTSTKSPSAFSHEPPIKRVYRILAGKLFDPLTRTLASNQVIIINRDVGIVHDVKSELEVEALENEFGQNVEITTIDLSHLVILPGLIDVHVHCELSFLTPN